MPIILPATTDNALAAARLRVEDRWSRCASGAAVTPTGATLRWTIPEATRPGASAPPPPGGPHLEAARLCFNWWLSTAHQQSLLGWSARTDIERPAGIKPAWKYPDAHFAEFPWFMGTARVGGALEADLDAVLRRGQVRPEPGWLGLHPGS
jgi:hypothetical protein